MEKITFYWTTPCISSNLTHFRKRIETKELVANLEIY